MPRLLLLASVLFSAPLFAQAPYINYRGVVNSASYARPGLPAGSIARGSIFAVFGRNFGPATLTQQPVFPLTNSLGGVTIQVSQGNVTKNAIPIATITGFVNAIMPSDMPLGKVKVTVTANNQTSNPAWINVVESSFGIFTVASSGLGPGILLNYNSATDFPVNNTRLSAKPGQIAILFGTGLGAVAHADNIAPTQVTLDAAQTEVFVGGKSAQVLYAGRGSCCSGLDQVYFNVPTDAPQGCFVPVQVRTRHAVVSNSITMAIQQNGQPCTDAFNPFGNALRAGGKLGVGVPLRTAISQLELDGTTSQYVVDEFFGAFRQLPALDTYFDAASALPPLGACTTYFTDATFSPGQLLQSLPGTLHAADSTKELTTAGAQRPITVSSLWTGLLGGLIGKSTTYSGSQPLFWGSGPFAFNLGASASAGPLSAQFNTFTPLTWPANDISGAINRANGLTLHWTGGNSTSEIAFIAGASEDTVSNSRALFICTANIAPGTFTVPPEILAALPRSPANSTRNTSWIYLANMRSRDPLKFSAPGIDNLFLIPTSANARTVEIQ